MSFRPDSDKGFADGLTKRIIRYAAVFSSVQGLALLCNLAMAKIKSAVLGPAGFGLTEGFNRTTDLIRTSTNLGVSSAAVPHISVQNVSNNDTELASAILVTRSWSLLTAMSGMLLCAVFASGLSAWAFDGDRGYAFQFVLMSLAVAASAIMGGEMAVLRGVGMMREVAMSQLLSALFALVVTIPLYLTIGLRGVAPALAFSGLGSMAITCYYSCRAFGYHARPFSREVLGKGFGMIGFGIFFTIAAFISAFAWSIVSKYMIRHGGMALNGLYNAGWMLVTYFTSLLLSVNDSEYFPRLSAAGNDMSLMHDLAAHQSRTMTMIVSPLIMLFQICLPIVVSVVLESENFSGSLAMAQLAVTGLLFKTAYQPIACIVLAKLDSKAYLIQETLCYISLVVCVTIGFRLHGLTGTGLGLSAWELFYFLMSLVIARIRYKFILPSKNVRQIFVQGILLAICTYGCMSSDVMCHWLMSLSALAISASYSFLSRFD